MSARAIAGLAALALGLPGCGAEAARAPVRVAVAANFAGAMQELVARFAERTGERVEVSTGSTGKLYAQIRNGAPFAVFFAADAARPELLEREGRALRRATYAVGRLALWSPQKALIDGDGAVLGGTGYRRLSLANPELAPYGAAARQVLEGRGLWHALQAKVVRGESVAQALQFVDSGNAELGFVAWAQVLGRGGSVWRVPAALHAPIEQQAALLDEAGRALLDFVLSDAGREIVRRHGYGPD